MKFILMKHWANKELNLLLLYAAAFYALVIYQSLYLSYKYRTRLFGLGAGLFADSPRDSSDPQWRNFHQNLPILSVVFAIIAVLMNLLREILCFKANGMSFAWLFLSLSYILYLHGACVVFILAIASINFLLVKIFTRTKYFSLVIWFYNVFFLVCNRVYEGYFFSFFGGYMAYLDNFRGGFRWHICFNFVTLRMISFGYDYHWALEGPHFDEKKHVHHCLICKEGKPCYRFLQERSMQKNKYSFCTYLCYLLYAPCYIAGPIISYNAFASQLDAPQKIHSARDMSLYWLRWMLSFFVMEIMTNLFHYNALATSNIWRLLSPLDTLIIGYGVLNFMWLKFYLIWRYFRFCSLICGIETPENMPMCINNCHSLEKFWRNWHASYNKWLVRYMYIPLGGSERKLFNIWVIFTFVALWHDIEWKLLSWAWLTCLFFLPEMVFKSTVNSLKAKNMFGEFFFRELHAFSGAVTITCLMIANLVGYVVGTSHLRWFISQFLTREGLTVLCGMLLTFYVGTKLMIYIEEARSMKFSSR